MPSSTLCPQGLGGTGHTSLDASVLYLYVLWIVHAVVNLLGRVPYLRASSASVRVPLLMFNWAAWTVSHLLPIVYCTLYSGKACRFTKDFFLRIGVVHFHSENHDLSLMATRPGMGVCD